MDHKPTMESSPSPVATTSALISHDDDSLKRAIQSILADEAETCQTRSSKIMDLIFQHRRKNVLELDRERIPPANSRFLHGGSNPNDPPPSQSFKESVKTKQKPKDTKGRKDGRRPASAPDSVKATQSGKGEDLSSADKESDDDDNIDDTDATKTEEDSDDEHVHDDIADSEEDDNNTDNTGKGEHSDEAEEYDTEEEEEEDDPNDDKAEPNGISHDLASQSLARSVNRIQTCIEKKNIIVSNRSLAGLRANSKKLASFFSSTPFFRFTPPLVTFFPRRAAQSNIHIDKLLVALSLPTISLFRFIMDSKLQPKRFSWEEKVLISKLVSLSKTIKPSDIRSQKVRSLCQ